MQPDGRPRPVVSHYVVLGLQPHMLRKDAAAAIVRRAYRRALLRHHPDKQTPASGGGGGGGGGDRPGDITVDQITTAWTVLSDPARRRAYDQELAAGRVSSGHATAAATADDPTMTGMEQVDLDDLAYDEVTHQWYRSCRCGNARGFAFGEQELEEEMEAAEAEATSAAAPPTAGELLVGCQDCSLWLCVHFAVVAADDGG